MRLVSANPPVDFISGPSHKLVLEEGFSFRHGETIAPFEIVYETFGTLNENRSNAILVCHALSPSAHAAGKYSHQDERSGWWDGLIGYGKAIDLHSHFVICVNIPGSPHGTTAPQSIEPDTGRPWGSRYPWPTIEDMVRVEKTVIDSLGITSLVSVVGGSLGGMQVLAWTTQFPEMVQSIICMASAAAVPVQGVAWHIIGRKLIESDHRFDGGDYYHHDSPLRGLELARMVGHMTYLSSAALERKFGRKRRNGTRQFEIDSYLDYQGEKFAHAFDANSYIRLQAAMDEMDLEEEFGSLEKAFAGYRGRALIISFDTDWLFPCDEAAKVQRALVELGLQSEHLEFQTTNGHDAFLLDYHLISPPVAKFLSSAQEK